MYNKTNLVLIHVLLGKEDAAAEKFASSQLLK